MKTIAFYLPQYHPIPENNEWWGKGFTEWTNVAKARPSFRGHYQPHIPSELGFYDLRLPEIRDEQAALAKEYGVTGFCYYHYWFNGRMLLEKPLNEVLASGKPDHEFCVCWANENWSRRWDGMDQQVLLGQDYEDYDPSEHIGWLAQAFRDSRYIRIQNKPLFLVYRASDIPNLKETVEAWREAASAQGFEGLYICCADNSSNILSIDDLAAAGFDAVYNFTPNLKNFTDELSLSTIPGLNIYSYKKLVEREINKSLSAKIPVFPCVFPSWDNSPRRRTNATVIQNEDPGLYTEWLKHSIQQVKAYSTDEQIVFINAWNEWGEGCHLEPDLKHGRMFLEATLRALTSKETNWAGSDGSTDNLQNEHLIDVTVEASRPIYIWGTGEAGKRTFKKLEESGVSIHGFIDNKPAKIGTELLGVKIFSRSILERPLNADVRLMPFVCIASMFHEEIETSLHELGCRRYTDYTINIESSFIRKERFHGVPVITFENSCYCNICGYNRFTNTRLPICEKCASVPSERMFIEILGEEVGSAGIPLSEWPKMKHVKLLNVGGLNKNIPYVDMIFTNKHKEVEEIGHADNDSVDFSLFRIDDVMSDEQQLRHCLNTLCNQSSKTIILTSNINISQRLVELLPVSVRAVHKVEREYRMYKTAYQFVTIIEG